MPQRSCPDVPLESVITYRHVPRWWQLVIRRGQVFVRWYNETSEMLVDAQYLEMRWLKSSEGCWKLVPGPTRMTYLFYDLAFFTLSAWENDVLPNYSKRERNWDPTYIVSEVSIAVHRFWNTPQVENEWDLRTVAAAMYDLMNLYNMDEDRRYRIYVTKQAKQTGIKLSIGRVVGFRCAFIVYSFL